MTSQSEAVVAEDVLREPFRVRHGQRDLGLHVDIRLCLLRAGKEKEANVIVVSDTEDETECQKGTDILIVDPSPAADLKASKADLLVLDS